MARQDVDDLLKRASVLNLHDAVLVAHRTDEEGKERTVTLSTLPPEQASTAIGDALATIRQQGLRQVEVFEHGLRQTRRPLK